MVLIPATILLLLFAAFDYVGFNVFGREHRTPYRVVQLLFQAALCYFGGTALGWSAVAAFMVMWWTWLADFLYYFMFDVWPRSYVPWYAGRAFKEEVLGDKVTWAFWTPYGLLRYVLSGGTAGRDVPIRGHELIFQGILGVAVALAISLC